MYAIRAARLFDGHHPDLVRDATIVIDRGRIVEIGHRSAIPVTDLGDVTLVPGLVDAHMHLAFDASTEPVAALTTATDEGLLDIMRRSARSALAAGITTVRDLGDRNYLALRLRDETAADPTAGPQILAAGPPITTTKGHCWFLGGEADGADGLRAAVREHAARGVDVIKVMASGGNLTPNSRPHESQYTLDELRAAVDEAHRHGLPITAHAHGTQAISDVVAAGFDSIEHCTFMTEDGIDDRPDVLAAIVASGIRVSVTVGMLPGGTPPPAVAVRFEAMSALFERVRRAGVVIAGSSDAGIGPAKPHSVLPRGLAMMVDRFGMPPVQALRALTSIPAELCGVGDRKGRLAVGYDADILAVAGDPFADPHALADVCAVYRLGHLIASSAGNVLA